MLDVAMTAEMKKTKCNATILFHDIPRPYDEPALWKSYLKLFLSWKNCFENIAF